MNRSSISSSLLLQSYSFISTSHIFYLGQKGFKKKRANEYNYKKG